MTFTRAGVPRTALRQPVAAIVAATVTDAVGSLLGANAT
jgi:hypothetical protein